MKKIYTAMIIGIILGNSVSAIAASSVCNRECTDEEKENADVVNDTDECNGVKYEPCTDGIIFGSCKACVNPKAKLVKKTERFGNCTYSYTACECSECTSCTSTDWTASGTGYEKKTTANCDCGTCTTTTQYRCAAGYYGTSTNGSTGCTQCPKSGGVAGQSVAGSNSAITSCYIPSNTTLSDSTGTYTYTSNCYYK